MFYGIKSGTSGVRAATRGGPSRPTLGSLRALSHAPRRTPPRPAPVEASGACWSCGCISTPTRPRAIDLTPGWRSAPCRRRASGDRLRLPTAMNAHYPVRQRGPLRRSAIRLAINRHLGTLSPWREPGQRSEPARVPSEARLSGRETLLHDRNCFGVFVDQDEAAVQASAATAPSVPLPAKKSRHQSPGAAGRLHDPAHDALRLLRRIAGLLLAVRRDDRVPPDVGRQLARAPPSRA